MAQVTSPQGQQDSTPSESVPSESVPSRRFRWLRWLIPAVVVAILAGMGVRWWLQRPTDDVLQLSGRIEGYETNLGTKVGGRIEQVSVREGDTVDRGEVIARLEDDELQAQLAAAKASYEAAQRQITQAQLQQQVLQSQIRETELALEQSTGDATGRVNQAEATVATAQAQLAAAQAQQQEAAAALRLAQLEQDRFASLVAAGAIPQQQFDRVQTQLQTAEQTLQARQAAVAAAQRQVNAAQGGLTQARTAELNPDIRSAQIERLQKQLVQATAQLEAVQAEANRAQAQQAEVEARLANLAIASPIDGVVLSRMVEPGEVIAAGTPVVSVLNLNDVFLRGYIPQGRLGEVRVGQAARVFLDSAPEAPLAAMVTAIDTEASFTPENIYFQEDRVTQVFGLKLSIENPQGFAKPGMPADGEILLEPYTEGEP